MKINYNAWRYLDADPKETKGGGAIIEAIEKNHKATTEQIEAVKSAQDASLTKAKEELTAEISAAKATSQKALEKAEELEKKGATAGFGGNPIQTKSFESQLEQKLTENKDKLPHSVGKKFTLEFERKVVGDMGSSASLTGSYFVAPTVVPGIVARPYNVTHVREVLTTGSTNSNVVRHLRDNGGEGGPAMVAEGGAKPQMDRDLSIEDAPVRKIATHLRVPEEMIEDIPFLTSFLTNIGTEEVLAVEDAQLLYGDGTGQNISGLADAGNFTAFAAGTTTTAPNKFDVLAWSGTQMRLAKRNPSVHLVNPADYYDIVSKKDTTENYILRGGGNGILPVDSGGVPIVQMNQITANDFITLDSRAAQIFFRSSISVRFYDQDQDNAIKNMVTIVIEERLALAIYFVNGIIKGTFSAAITDLTS